jgi:RNA polymerase sigma-70 factor (ECF subfamily)
VGKLIPIRRPGEQGAAQLSDEALVAACAVGDTSALGVLFDRFQAHTRRFLARASTARAEELDDLVQKTFLEVHRSAPKFRGGSVRSWIFGVAINVARHQARSAGRRRAHMALFGARPQPEVERPDALAERTQLLARVNVALTELSPELREVFVLCEVEEFPGVEAARILGLREGTLRRRLHDARRRLRELLEGGPR